MTVSQDDIDKMVRAGSLAQLAIDKDNISGEIHIGAWILTDDKRAIVIEAFPNNQHNTHSIKFDKSYSNGAGIVFENKGELTGYLAPFIEWPGFEDMQLTQADWLRELSTKEGKRLFDKFTAEVISWSENA